MWGRNAKRLAALEAEVTALRDHLNSTGATLPKASTIDTKSKVGAVVTMVVYTVIFGGLMWFVLAQGAAIGHPGLIALIGAIGVGLSVVFTNALSLIEEWTAPRGVSVESVLSMLAIFTGAIGSMLVILDLI